MLRATLDVLNEIAKDVRGGLLETVGVESALSLDDERCSMVLELTEEADTRLIARAIDAENVESWRDEQGRVHIAVNPWYSTKDVDQTVLSTVKVIHVLLGIHASDTVQPKNFKQKLIASVMDVMLAQKGVEKK